MFQGILLTNNIQNSSFLFEKTSKQNDHVKMSRKFVGVMYAVTHQFRLSSKLPVHSNQQNIL